MQKQTPARAGLKRRAVEELKEYWITALYLFLILGAFTFYRRMVLAAAGVDYLHYGVAVIEALVIAKVVWIGRVLGLDKRFDRGPLILAVIFKALLFALLALLFGVLERVVEGLVHKDDWARIARGLLDDGAYELLARLMMLFVAFVPFFAFWEIGSVLGRRELIEMFFSRKRSRPSRA